MRCYHGLGGTIQFIRYVPLIKAIAQEAVIWSQPVLGPILRTMPSIHGLLPLHDGTPEVVRVAYGRQVTTQWMCLAQMKGHG